MTKRIFLAICGAGIFLSSLAHADTILFKSGNKIEGVVRKASEHTLTVEERFGSGTVTTEYPREDIAEIIEEKTEIKEAPVKTDEASFSDGKTSGSSSTGNIFSRISYDKAKRDLKANLLDTFGSNYTAVEMMLNEGMKDFKKLQTIPNTKVNNQILSDLKDTFYPNFTAIWMMYKENIKSYNNLM